MKKIDPDQVENILVRGTNWVGDAVMSVPAMKEIRRVFPHARISLLVRPWVADVYSAVDFVDEIVPFEKDGIHKGWRGLRRLAADLSTRRFDLAVLLQNAIEAAVLARWARIPRRLGYARDGRGPLLTHRCRIDPETKGIHQVYYYLDILSQAGWIERRIWRNRSYLPTITVGVKDSDVRGAGAMLRAAGVEEKQPVIGINPGAFYGGAKRWVSERYAGVADALAREYGARIVIFGGPDERRIAEEVAGSMREQPVILAGRTTLGQLMGLIRRCALFLTNDSGPMHLAAALDVPQLAIFGSTSEIATGPWSPKATVVKKQADCNPCFLRECPTDFRCMTAITVEMVLEKARERLKEVEHKSKNLSEPQRPPRTA